MDLFGKEEMKRLMEHEAEVCVSFYLPTFMKGKETQQNPLRFKNQLRTAEKRFHKLGYGPSDTADVLAPAEGLLKNPDFWRNQDQGLAVFLSRGIFHTFRLPISFEELVVVTGRFHIAPLLPWVLNNRIFYLLALSQKRSRLFRCTRQKIQELDPEYMPLGISDTLRYRETEKQLQFHTGTGAGGGITAPGELARAEGSASSTISRYPGR